MGLVAFDRGLKRAGEAGSPLRALVDVGFPCNLGCSGCPRRRAAPPDRAALAALCARAADAVLRSDAERVSAVLFGGEPLVDPDAVADAAAVLRAACERRGAAFDASLITNGTLLDDRAAGALAASGIARVQVTLAGPPDVHDLRRPLGGAGSFHRILGNLRAARSRLRLVVRCDTEDGCGLAGVADLVHLLEEEGLFDAPEPAAVLVGRPASYASQARALLSFGGLGRVVPFRDRAPGPVPPAG